MPAKYMNNRIKTFCELEVANPTSTIKELAQEYGVGYSTALKWTVIPDYKDYKQKLLKEIWKDYEKMAISNVKKIANNDKNSADALKANLYILDSLGYKATDKVEVNTNTIKVILDD